MSRTMEILLVEDSEADAYLLAAELKRHGYIPVLHRVQTREEFLSAGQSRAWDVVICDYSLPRFNGLEALELFRELGLDLPFIVVSGVIGEEKAVELMKLGANDYILKDNLARLVPALERELAAAEERRCRRRAEGARQYLAAIVESSEDAICGNNLDSVVTSWNPAAERMFGYSAKEMIGRSIVTLFPLGRRDELLDVLASIRRGETVRLHDTERLHKNGGVIPVSLITSPIKSARGEIIGASSIARDIRQLKQAEQERRQLSHRLSTAMDQVQEMSCILPICMSCKRIRDDQGYWEQVEIYLLKHSSILFSHSLCPQCAAEFDQELETP